MAQEYYSYTLINHLYYPEKIESGVGAEEKILNKYINGDYEKLKNSVHIPDIVTNINGNHEYKLVSGKDIDFENIFLENSDISEACWGNFDESRRWPNNTSIRINEMYELMNVIDYLLCATKDLYDEIIQLKYTGNEENVLWFVSNSISNNPKYYLQRKLTVDHIEYGDPNYGIEPTLLNNKQYYTSLNAKDNNTTYSFGIASVFHVQENSGNYEFTRILKNKHINKKLNGVEGYISEHKIVESRTQSNYTDSTGRQTMIYGYLIGTDLKIYPGFNIFNFLYPDSNYMLDSSNFVDSENKKMKYLTFFKYNNTTFKKVFVEFLGNITNNVVTAGENYILYILDTNSLGNEVKKIIYATKQEYIKGTNSIPSKYGDEYERYEYSSGDYVSEQYVTVNQGGDEDIYIPFLYKIKDYNIIELSVITPHIETFETASASIDIKYFKNQNNLKIKVIDTVTDKEIKMSDEHLQEDVVLYNPQRYNIPEKNDILFEIKSDVLNKQGTNNKTDDEYLDYPYYWNEASLASITDYDYYKYVGLDSESSNPTFKRNFEKFNNIDEFKTFLRENKFSDTESFTQVYKKIENPYDIKYVVTSTELLNQSYPYDNVKAIVNEINDNCISKTNNNIILNYTLPEDAEQIKLYLELTVEETGKSKEAYEKIPLNINKIHDLSINFNSPYLYMEEAKKYKNIYYNVTKSNNTSGTNFQNYTAEEWKTSNGNYLTAFDLYTMHCGEYETINGNMNVLSFLNSNSTFNQEIINSNSCHLEKRTYDNTVSGGRILNITYNPDAHFLNLLGGKKLDFELNKNSNGILDGLHNVNAYVMNGTEKINCDQENLSIFAINGLGLNYYCHGADQYAWTYKSGLSQEFKFYHSKISHSLLAPCDINSSNNIIKFLGISLYQKDIDHLNNVIKDYTSYIQVKNNHGDYEYYENEEANNNENKYEYKGEFLKDFNNISTDDIEICKYTFSYDMLKEVNPVVKNYVSYNIQSAYINVLSSTFYPSPNSYPPIYIDEDNNISSYYDLNKEEDYLRYIEYKNCWGADYNVPSTEDNYYRPITLSLKMLENHDSGVPFFNESNEAKLKFNIVRATNTKTSSEFVGLDNITSLISQDLRYYISDLVKIAIPTTGDANIVNLITYTGSYLYLDTDLYNSGNDNNHIIKYKEQIYYANHEYNEGVIILKNNFKSENNTTIPYPIPAKFDEYDNLWYNYDIVRVSEINKIKYEVRNEHPITSNNNSGHYDNLNYDVDCEISYFVFNNNPENISNGFELHLTPLYHFGSKNYKSIPPAASDGAKLRMDYISRTHQENHLKYENNEALYSTVNGIDIFRYSLDFDNIYIKYDTNIWYTLKKQYKVDCYTYRLDEVFKFNTQGDNKDNIYKYYRTQVEAFLSNKIGAYEDILEGDTIIGLDENENDVTTIKPSSR